MEVNGYQQIFRLSTFLIDIKIVEDNRRYFIGPIYTYYEECVSKLLTVAIDFHSKEKIQ